MLKLTNVSKYYHSNDIVALGLRKVNLEFKLGEFIAVTGESGSGKSTLLNVISGLDTYEDGEMYVNDEETSYYSIEEWESYRRQYIGFVFQNYNIIDSYSVLENVMVALTIQGYPSDKIKDRALELIDKVGLSSHINHKASKLSGGQKQRTVIARALAKDCPIIVCDEPTGNLDSESSKTIMELLQEISQDKLVIVVTHNYDEVEDFATRKIRLFDGEVVEDKKVKKRQDVSESVRLANYSMRFIDLVTISLRNLFRTPRRTIFTMIVMMFIAIIFTFSYGSFKKNSSQAMGDSGYGYFENVTERRIIVTKFDETAFTDQEIKDIEDLRLVNDVVEHDVIMDSKIYLPITEYGWTYMYGVLINPADMLLARDLHSGRMPENETEIVISGYDDYKVGDTIQLVTANKKSYDWDLSEAFAIEYTIVGMTKNLFPNSPSVRFYFHEDFIQSEDVIESAYNYPSEDYYFDYDYGYMENTGYINTYGVFDFEIEDENIPENLKTYSLNLTFGGLNIVVDNALDDNDAKISIDYIYNLCQMYDIDYEDDPTCFEDVIFDFHVESSFYHLTEEITIVGERVDGTSYTEQQMAVNQATYDKLVDDGAYQISVLVYNTIDADKVIEDLSGDGYNPMYPSNISNDFVKLMRLVSNIGFGSQVVVLMVIIYFISYIVLKNVQNAKKKDYLIFRSIGSSRKDLNKVTLLELFFTVTFAYITTIILLIINEQFTTFIPQYLIYFSVSSYLLIFLLLTILSLLLGQKFNRKIFSNSVITSLKQE